MKFKKTCVVIPCYKVSNKIENVINNIDFNIVEKVFVVDDKCPENTGEILKKKKINRNIEIFFFKKNLGVGGATIYGFQKALEEGFDIIFKIDGDGQHDPKLINIFKHSLIYENINFCKGSRFLISEEAKKNS